MRAITAFVFLVLCLAPPLQAQWSARLSPGLGSYQLSGLKDFHGQLVESSSYPVPLTTTDLFPSYPNLELSVLKERDKFLFGLTVALGETGARSGYRDFSGSISLEERVRFIGIFVNVALQSHKEGSKWSFDIDLRPGLLINRLEISELVYIGASSTATSFSFNSMNLVAQPTVGLTRHLGNFDLSARIGYQVTLYAGSFSLSGNSDAILTSPGGSEVTSDWSGLRGAVGLGYRFGSGKSSASTED